VLALFQMIIQGPELLHIVTLKLCKAWLLPAFSPGGKRKGRDDGWGGSSERNLHSRILIMDPLLVW
jgi:hypothetical protein